jgi:hypothetical protein
VALRGREAAHASCTQLNGENGVANEGFMGINEVVGFDLGVDRWLLSSERDRGVIE